MTVAASRPGVSVVIPFAGSDAELEAVLAWVTTVMVGAADEILLADNGPGTDRAVPFPAGVRRIAASGLRAPGFARNRGAAEARGEWLVFLDADTRPGRGLLDAYFTPPPRPDTAVLAGGIRDLPGGATRAAHHSAERAHMSHETTLARAGTPYAQTANCAVRRAAFASVGGFATEARYGEDADLCWRLAAAGWGLEVRPGALVDHLSRPTLPGLLAQLTGHGTGAAWLERRYPGEFPALSAGALIRRCGRRAQTAVSALLRGRPAAAAVATIELLETLAFTAGRRRSNRPRPTSRRRA